MCLRSASEALQLLTGRGVFGHRDGWSPKNGAVEVMGELSLSRQEVDDDDDDDDDGDCGMMIVRFDLTMGII